MNAQKPNLPFKASDISYPLEREFLFQCKSDPNCLRESAFLSFMPRNQKKVIKWISGEKESKEDSLASTIGVNY